MRVYAPGQLGSAAATRLRRGASDPFSVPSQEPASSTARAATLRSLGGIDALVALQAFEAPGERQRRAVKSGRRTLDALDALKVRLLSGQLDPTDLNRLKNAAEQLEEGTGDPRLDVILAEIRLRAAVELAKFARAAGASLTA
jgi:Class II flagellar assembly regulator